MTYSLNNIIINKYPAELSQLVKTVSRLIGGYLNPKFMYNPKGLKAVFGVGLPALDF
jgi:hypothetical protein